MESIDVKQIRYGLLFLSRIEQRYDKRRIIKMLNSEKLTFSYVKKGFVMACKSNDIQYANLIIEVFPENFSYATNSTGNINRFHIVDK